MKLKEVIDRSIVFFKEKNFETPRLDAELLIANVLQLRRIDLYLKFDQPLGETELQKCRDVVRRRSKGEPVAYILGRREFFGLSFAVGPEVLIPRPETETLVEYVLDWCTDKQREYKILDLGTGSGCISLSLLKNLPMASATSVDISSKALRLAQLNAAELQLANRVQFICADAAGELGQDRYDVIVANPPYIAETDERVEKNVREFEPHQALFCGDGGLACLSAWSASKANLLKKPGLMIFEIGADHSSDAKSIFAKLKIFSEVKTIRDLAGIERHIVGVING